LSDLTDKDRRLRPTAFSAVTKATSIIAGLFTLVMMTHVCVDVFSKYFFNAPVRGTLEVVSHYYMVIVVFLPIAYIDWVREAISVDLFFPMFPKWLKLGAVGATLLGMTFVYGGFCLLSFQDALKFMARNEVAMGSDRIVVWPARYLLAFGLGLAATITFTQLVLFVTGRDRSSWLSGDQNVHEV
jgi:TRAP-type C4-dicarboxylate transport system permease small subunit